MSGVQRQNILKKLFAFHALFQRQIRLGVRVARGVKPIEIAGFDLAHELHLSREIQFVHHVGDQPLVATHDYLGRPVVGQGFQEFKFKGQVRGVGPQFSYAGINALHEGRNNGLAARMVVRVLTLHVAPVTEKSGSDVAVYFSGAEQFGDGTRGLSPPHFELEGAVGSRDVALREEEIVFVSGVNVRDAPLVADDLHRFLQAADF